MKSLKDYFNRLGTVEVRQEDLAEIVRPFLKSTIIHPKANHIAAGWHEMESWVTIGWEAERSNRGTATEGLCHSLKIIHAQLDKFAATANDNGPVRLRKDDLEVLHATSWQMREAARHLEEIFAKMEKGPVYYTRNVDGINYTFMDLSNTIPIWCRPNEDHALMAERLRQSADALDQVMKNHNIRPASDRKVQGYLPPKFG